MNDLISKKNKVTQLTLVFNLIQSQAIYTTTAEWRRDCPGSRKRAEACEYILKLIEFTTFYLDERRKEIKSVSS
jgi:hypothetical protein